MTFRVSLLIDADGKAAVQEVRRVEKAQKDAARASETLGSKSRGAAGGVDTLGSSAGASAGRVDTMADANQRAAGSMANLTAQGNDVLTMLIAGQNPMQLAIQQGTQINQVWGQMGVKGKDAFKLVGGAIASMLTPINLITIGSIAAAGAMTQWFASAEEEAKTFEDRMDDLSSAVDEYSSYAKLAVADTSELEEKFGSAAGKARGFAETLRDSARAEALTAMRGAVEELGDDLGGISSMLDSIRITRDLALKSPEASSDLALWTEELNRQFGVTIAEAERIEGALRNVSNATGPREGAAAAQELNSVLIEVYGSAEKIPEVFREANAEAAKLGLKVSEMVAADAAGMRALLELGGELVTSFRDYASERLAAAGAAEEMLESLRDQVELQRLIALYGEDSAEVADHRAAAERAAFEEMLATHDVAESLKEEMRANFELARELAGVDVASGIWEGANAASAMAANLSAAVAQMNALVSAARSSVAARTRFQRDQNRLNTVGDPIARAGGEAVIDFREALDDGGYGLITGGRASELAAAESEVRTAAEDAERLTQAANAADTEYAKLQRTLSSGGGSRRGGGSSRASAVDKEREAVEKLISGLQDQLALLRETDPVQKEMLRNREALKGATDAEREAVRGLIGTLQEEEEALERQADLADYLKDTGYDLFRGATQGADALAAAADRAAEALAEAVFQAILLGEGPLAGLLGGGEGGLLGALANSLAGTLSGAPARAAGGMVGEPAPRKSDRRTGWRSIEARAAGGMIYGRGDGTSDDNLTWLSSGEFVTNAKATARNRGLLERINAGEDFPRFAAGGGVSGGTTAPGAVQVAFYFDNRSSVPVQGEIEEVPAQGGGRAYKMVLSDMVGSALSTPGGGARRTLKDGFGLKPRGTRR